MFYVSAAQADIMTTLSEAALAENILTVSTNSSDMFYVDLFHVLFFVFPDL